MLIRPVPSRLRRPPWRVRPRPVTRCLLGVALSFGVMTGAEPPSANAQTQTVERHLYVSVLLGSGSPLQGLRDGDFFIREDGIDREVLRAGLATAPMQIDVLVDNSAAARTIMGDLRRAAFPSWANRARDLMLDIGPEQTGGHRIDLSTVNGLGEVLSRLAVELSNQYLVVYAGARSLLPPQVRVAVNTSEPITVRAVPARFRSRTAASD